MRCEQHGLAAGPDGECVLCKRSRGSRAGSTLAVIAISVVALALVSAIVVKLSAGEGDTEPVAVAEIAVAPESPVEADEPEHGSAPAAIAEAPIAPEPTPLAPATATAAPMPTASASAAPTAADLRAALRRVEVKLYTTSWCPHCVRARRWLEHNSIAFTEYDVEKNPSAKREHRKLAPQGGVPTLDVDGDVMTGFSEQRAAHMIAAATQKRLNAR